LQTRFYIDLNTRHVSAQGCLPLIRRGVYGSYSPHHYIIDINSGWHRRRRPGHSFLHDFSRFLYQARNRSFEFHHFNLQYSSISFLQKSQTPGKRLSLDRLRSRKHHVAHYYDGQYGRHSGLNNFAKFNSLDLTHPPYDFTSCACRDERINYF
jgi:hypothetical protein